MIIFINLLLLIGLLLFGYRCLNKVSLKKFYWSAALLKISMGVLVGLLYRYYYMGGDTFAYFDAAVALKNSAFSSLDSFSAIYFKSDYEALPGFRYDWIPSAFFVKILSLLTLLTGDNYWLTGIYLSVFSFFGLWNWVSVLCRLLPNQYLSIIAGFLFPSLLFWSSGVLKEALVIPSLAILLSQFIKYFLGDKLKGTHYVLALTSFVVLAILKYFIAAIFLALVLAVLLARLLLANDVKWYIELIAIFFLLLVVGSLVGLLHPNLWPSRIAGVIYNNYTAYLAASADDTTLVFNQLTAQPLGLLISLPKAIFAGLLLPLIPVPGSLLTFLAVAENWILLVLIVVSISQVTLPNPRNHRLLLWSGVFFVLITSGLIALSTPNLGTLARYKTSYLLVLLPLVMPGINTLYRKFVQKG